MRPTKQVLQIHNTHLIFSIRAVCIDWCTLQVTWLLNSNVTHLYFTDFNFNLCYKWREGRQSLFKCGFVTSIFLTLKLLGCTAILSKLFAELAHKKITHTQKCKNPCQFNLLTRITTPVVSSTKNKAHPHKDIWSTTADCVYLDVLQLVWSFTYTPQIPLSYVKDTPMTTPTCAITCIRTFVSINDRNVVSQSL